jgi:hypothetical protein
MTGLWSLTLEKAVSNALACSTNFFALDFLSSASLEFPAQAGKILKMGNAK